MNDYRVRIINHTTGEIIEHEFPFLDLAQIYYDGIVSALGITWNSDCEYFIEHRVDTWERVPDEDEDDEECEDYTDDDGKCEDYRSEDGSAPCDGVGHCIGPACPYYVPADEWTDEDEEYFEKYFVNSSNTREDW